MGTLDSKKQYSACFVDWENYKQLHTGCAILLNFYEYFLLKKKETIMSSTLISLYSKIAKYEQNQFGLDVDRDGLVKKTNQQLG